MFAVTLFSNLLIGKAHAERKIKPPTKVHFDIKSYFPDAMSRKANPDLKKISLSSFN